MRTAVLHAPRKLDLVDRSKPVAGSGEVVVRTAATAVCHTDLSIYVGEHPGVKYPVVMGHESTGVIDSLGEGVSEVKPGQHVIINPIIACGRCDSCLRGAGNLCRVAGLFGREVEGSLSQYVKLPSQYIHVLPPRLPLGQATAGLLHARLAVLTGATVIAVSRTRWKLEMAERMGAHHVVERAVDKAVEEVRRLTGGKGADVVIDAEGGAETLRAAIDMLRPGGRFSAFAVSHETVRGFSTFPLYFGEISIIGSRALTPQDMNPSIQLIASGAVDVSGFITAKYPLTDSAAAFEEYERNPSRILRIVIDSGS